MTLDDWKMACLTRDAHTDFIAGRAAHTVHHIVSRRWKPVVTEVKNGISVSRRTHAIIHAKEREMLRYIVTRIIGKQKYAELIAMCEREPGFKSSMYYELYEELCK